MDTHTLDPMTYADKKQLIESQDRHRILCWFENHVAVLKPGDNAAAVLKWYKPGTLVNSITYIFEGRYVVAIGDLGDSIWAFSQAMNLWEIPDDREFSYFMSKLRCSDSKYPDWNSELAILALREDVEQAEEGVGANNAPSSYEMEQAESSLYFRSAWIQFLHETDCDYFRDDPSSFTHLGDIPSIHHRAQHLGLILAREQIKNHNQEYAAQTY